MKINDVLSFLEQIGVSRRRGIFFRTWLEVSFLMVGSIFDGRKYHRFFISVNVFLYRERILFLLAGRVNLQTK